MGETHFGSTHHELPSASPVAPFAMEGAKRLPLGYQLQATLSSESSEKLREQKVHQNTLKRNTWAAALPPRMAEPTTPRETIRKRIPWRIPRWGIWCMALVGGALVGFAMAAFLRSAKQSLSSIAHLKSSFEGGLLDEKTLSVSPALKPASVPSKALNPPEVRPNASGAPGILLLKEGEVGSSTVMLPNPPPETDKKGSSSEGKEAKGLEKKALEFLLAGEVRAAQVLYEKLAHWDGDEKNAKKWQVIARLCGTVNAAGTSGVLDTEEGR